MGRCHGVRDMERIRIDVAGLPIPDVLVAAKDVTRGNLRPKGYCLAADRPGVAADEIVVFEDPAAGMEAYVLRVPNHQRWGNETFTIPRCRPMD